MKSLKVLFEIFMPEARFPDEKFWNKDGSAIHPDPKGPARGSVGKTHGDLGAVDRDDAQSSTGKKVIYFGYEPSGEMEVPYEVADEEDPRDPWNGGFPGAIDAFEQQTGTDAHEVGFWLDTDDSLNCDYNGRTHRWDSSKRGWFEG